ncbi:hypothetical protein HDU80_001287 [Chytriomyces hyalinus]|nr:hypothetical protein HDU80_001287 [Chytriomyces hyalinus]
MSTGAGPQLKAAAIDVQPQVKSEELSAVREHCAEYNDWFKAGEDMAAKLLEEPSTTGYKN